MHSVEQAFISVKTVLPRRKGNRNQPTLVVGGNEASVLAGTLFQVYKTLPIDKYSL